MSRMMKLFISTIAAMGIVRFALNMSGLPNEIVKYFSMTAIIIAGVILSFLKMSSAPDLRTHDAEMESRPMLVLPSGKLSRLRHHRYSSTETKNKGTAFEKRDLRAKLCDAIVTMVQATNLWKCNDPADGLYGT